MHETKVKGVGVDPQTRCAHYHKEIDVIAIKFRCCGEWYPCFSCHAALAGHSPDVWKLAEYDEKAILCGNCGHRLTIAEYMDCGSRCPQCAAAFNPGCANHYHLYFETQAKK